MASILKLDRIEDKVGQGVDVSDLATGYESITDQQTGLAKRTLQANTLAALKSLPTDNLTDGDGARITTTGRAGDFYWDSSDLSAEVTAGTQEGIYVAPDGQDGTNGAWRRKTDGLSALMLEWFGVENEGDATDAINSIHGMGYAVCTSLSVIIVSQTITQTALKIFAPKQLTIRPASNIRVLDITGPVYLGNVKIQTNSLATSYTETPVVIRSGSGALQMCHLWDNLVIEHYYLNDTAECLRLTTLENDGDTTSTGYIAYCTASGYTSRYGGLGFELEIPEEPTGSFIQGNTFANFNIASATQMKSTDGETMYNSFPGYVAQFSTGGDTGDLRGSISGTSVDAAGLELELKRRSDFTGFITPIAVKTTPGLREARVTSPTFTVRDGMVEEAYGWPLDIFNDGDEASNLINGPRMGHYSLIEYCEGAALSNKWELVNATQSPLGVQDGRQNHGITISGSSGNQAIARVPNVFITGRRYPRVLAVVRERQGGDFSSIANTFSETGLLSDDQSSGVFIRSSFNATNDGGLVEAVVKSGGVESAYTLTRRSDGADFTVFYGAKLYIEIVFNENSVDFWVTYEGSSDTHSYAENRVYNRQLQLAAHQSVDFTDSNFPDLDEVILPTFLQSDNPNTGRALCFFGVKSRYAK